MLDINFIRENPDKVRQAAQNKRIPADIDRLLEVDGRWRAATSEIEQLRAEQNKAGKEIAKLTGDDKQQAISRMADIKRRAKDLADSLESLEAQRGALLLTVPQPADPEVPVGKDDTENVELRKWGTPREFDFEPKDHVELGELLDIVDIPRGVKLAGTRNYALRGPGAELHYAVLRLASDLMVAKGYTLLNVPVLVNERVMYGTGYFPIGRDDAYLCERDEQALVGTAEVSVTAFHMDETLSADDLPIRYAALSTCFRREAGAAGKDTRGLYRIHFFDKVEQVVIGPNDRDASIELHQEILANAEDVLQKLELPYRVVNVCTGDLGLGQVQKFDIETWMPSRDSYSETHSASRFYEFQARRLNIRYRDADGKLQYCHTLNNTVIASPRILIPILETHQNADGSVTVPQALRPYMGGRERIEPQG